MAKIKESKASYSAEPITTVTARGQTEIPRALRKRYHVTAKSRLRWKDTGNGLLVMPVEKAVAPRNGGRRQAVAHKPRTSDRAFLAWLNEWMKEPDDWTQEQWDEFERDLRANRLRFRDIEP
jgi:bifunctional DNA-binding transcriptional regulator/antitoxin component of YhaV-PrlF toxin-antitoxin module